MTKQHSEAVCALADHITRFARHIPKPKRDEFIESATEIAVTACNDAELKAQIVVGEALGLSTQELERA